MLHELCVKLHQVHTECGKGTHAAQAAYPRHDIGDPALQGGSKPALLVGESMSEARFAITGTPLPPATAHRPTTCEGIADSKAAMLQVGGKDHFTRCLIDNGDACGGGTRINLDAQWIYLGFLHGPFQDNGKGKSSIHGRFP